MALGGIATYPPINLSLLGIGCVDIDYKILFCLLLGVKAVVSLNEDHELKLTNTEEQWKKHGVELLKLPTKDFVSAPSQVIT